MDIFQGKVAIVTGGASGMGRAVSEELGRRGAVVVVADRNASGAEAVASGIAAAGGRARAAALDVTSEEAVRALVADTVSAYGQLDYMFNNAGIAIGGEVRDMSLDHWRQVLDVNLWGVIHGTRAVYSVMVKQGSGHIVNTASLAGLVPAAVEIPYTASKFAVVGLSTALRVEGAALGVKVSVVCPGFVKTGIFEASVAIKADKQAMFDLIPVKLMGVDKAALAILAGTERNRSIIAFPFHARFFWWLWRIHPELLSPLGRMNMAKFRERCRRT